MRPSPLLAILWLMCTAAFSAAAEFPPPGELPPQAELPDPLALGDGGRVESADRWRTQRRPELRALLEHYMYGHCPPRPEALAAKVLLEDHDLFGAKGGLKEVELSWGPPGGSTIRLLIATPHSDAPASCFVGANFGGNHLLTADPRVALPAAWVPARYPGVVDHRATEAGRGQQADVWPLEQILERGYAVATFYCGDVQPDRPEVDEGMRATMAPAHRGDPSATATIMWWAWGLHRAVDYLETDDAIDGERLIAVGHSRLGKTALLAGALDERIAVTIANQAGCGGSAPSRQHDPRAESVKRITAAFPHWFCGNFARFGDDPSRLPFDQHSLVALCAPRPVLLTNAAEDLWANPAGQFEVLRAATPVYELLGVEGLAADEMPAADGPLIGSRLGYWIRAGEHAMTPADWKVYMDYADRWVK